MKDSTKFANDVAKKDNDEALAGVKKSGKTQIVTLTAPEKAAWKKAMDKAHKDNTGRIGADIVKEVYAATGYTP
jgi:C4-dicarboxylate-binding protein DctP